MFTFNGQTYAAYPIAVKLRNVDKAKEIMTRIAEVAASTGKRQETDVWRSALTKFPELTMYVNLNGNYNVATIMERARQNEEAYKRDHAGVDNAPAFDKDAAIEEAQQWCANRIQQIMLTTPELGKLVAFSTGAFPRTIEALTAGIEIVREIVDRVKTPAESLAMIDQPIEHEFWQDVDAGEVASFIDTFRSQY